MKNKKYNKWFCKKLYNYITYKEKTSEIYPWAMSKEEIFAYASLIQEECDGSTDTNTIHFAIDKICGMHPELAKYA